jgi:hypothetical protein
VEQALASALYTSTPPEQPLEHTASLWTTVTRLCRCDSFVVERVRMAEGVEMQLPYAEMMIWIVVEGRSTIVCAGLPEPMVIRAGDTVVLPAALKDARVLTTERSMWLEISVPVESSLRRFERPDRAALAMPTQRYVPLNVAREE